MPRTGLRLCILNRHDPIREDAKWDGENYVGTCRKCGHAIRRVERIWQADRAPSPAPG